MDRTTNCTNVRTHAELMSQYSSPSTCMPSHHSLGPRILRSRIGNNAEEMYKRQAATLLVHHRQSRSLERKRLEGVLTNAYEGWKLRHNGQETIDESAVPQLIALLTIPAEEIPLNAKNYQISSELFIPLAHTLSSHLRAPLLQLSRTLTVAHLAIANSA